MDDNTTSKLHSGTRYTRDVTQNRGSLRPRGGGLAKHYHKGPDQLTDEELKSYLYYLAQERKLSPSSINQVVCGLRLFYKTVLHARWTSCARRCRTATGGCGVRRCLVLRRSKRLADGRLPTAQSPRLSHDGLWGRAAAGGSLPPQGRAHQPRPDANPGGARQGSQGSVYAALAGTAQRVGAVLALGFARSTGCFRRRTIRSRRWMGERLRRCSTGPWRGRVCRTGEGSIRCATVSPRTCWRRGWRSPSCSGS